MKKSEIFALCAEAIEGSEAIAQMDLFSCLLIRHGECGPCKVPELQGRSTDEVAQAKTEAEMFYRDLMFDPEFNCASHMHDQLLHQITEAFDLGDNFYQGMEQRNLFRAMVLWFASYAAASEEREAKRNTAKLMADLREIAD